MDQDLSTQLENGDATIEVKNDKIVLTQPLTTEFSFQEATDNVTNLSNKIEELKKGIDQQYAIIANHEQQIEALKKLLEDWRNKVRIAEQNFLNGS